MPSNFSIRGSISGSSTGLTRRSLPLVAAILAKRLGLNIKSITFSKIEFIGLSIDDLINDIMRTCVVPVLPVPRLRLGWGH